MRHFCTLFDRNYLHKGVTMYESLVKTCRRNFTLYILCVDEEAFNIMLRLKLPFVYLVSLDMLETFDPKLRLTKMLPPSKYGSQRDNYIWALAPYFSNYILNQEMVKEGEYVAYVDADIFFYKDPDLILKKVGESGMGIHTHRFREKFSNEFEVGFFNVGVVVFRNDKEGLYLSDFWRTLVMTTDHPHYEKYGTCGDQKYLDLIYEECHRHICIFDEGQQIHHGAPWCSPIVGNELNFYHFSHFNIVGDLNNNPSWKDCNKDEWHPANEDHVKPLYENYFQQILNVHDRIQKTGYSWIHQGK